MTNFQCPIMEKEFFKNIQDNDHINNDNNEQQDRLLTIFFPCC